MFVTQLLALQVAFIGAGSAGGMPPPGTPVYTNEVDPVLFAYNPGPNQRLADDLTLADGGCDSVYYNVSVYGFNTESIGGTYNAHTELWTGDPCTPGSTMIAGTARDFLSIANDNNSYMLEAAIEPPVAIPATVWLAVTFSGPAAADAAWDVALQAEIGSTRNEFSENDTDWNPDLCGLFNFTGGSPFAGFWANINCEVTTPPYGACCSGVSCTQTTQAACTAPGVWRGAFTACEPNACQPGGGFIRVPVDYSTIQGAIAAAYPLDTIIVDPGTYREKINFLGKAITVRSSGGAAATTIDAAGLGGTVVTCVSGEGPDTLLDGFTIKGGTGTTLYNGFTYGGGMRNHQSSPTVSNCAFSGNVTHYGSGMYNESYSSPTLTNCTFTGNIAYFGGAGMYNEESNPTLVACALIGNRVTQDAPNDGGGGMYNDLRSDPTVTDCTFGANIAPRGGGMFNDRDSNPTVTNCVFTQNSADSGGAGMYNRGGSGGFGGNFPSSPTVTNCTFSFNRSSFGNGAGMLNNYNSSPSVSNSTFTGNTASNGGGMYNVQGGFTLTSCTCPTVTNCTFIGNTAIAGGGGMFNGGSSPTVTNCTFTGNRAGLYAGGMYNSSDPFPYRTVTNCILWGDVPDEIVNSAPASATLFSDVRMAGGGVLGGSGNINLDPMFVRPANPGPDGGWDGVQDDYGDLRLRPDSPCIDAGDPGFLAQNDETDLDGHARVLCGRVDMGAYEFGFLSEFDCDRRVTLSDFASWGSCMLGPDSGPYGGGCGAFDSNFDLDVDLRDLAVFQNSIIGP